jgi:hypothetical protein
MALLPKPYPDEVIGSVIARGAWQLGLPLKVLLEDVFGPQRSCFSFLMGTGFSRLEAMTGTDAEVLLLSHTVFPYATAFMARETREALKGKALLEVAGEDCLSSLTKNVSHGVPYRRLCPLCTKEDMAMFGESYWRRQHHLPGALVCIRHGTKLHTANAPLRGRTQSRDVSLPHIVVHEGKRARRPLEQLRSIAELSVRVLDWGFQFDKELLQDFRAKSIALGYKMNSGDIAGHALSNALQTYHGSSLLADAGCTMSRRTPWPALMLRPNGVVPFATPKYIFMQTFLEHCPTQATSVVTGYKKPGKKPRDFKRLDSRLSKRLQTLVRKAQQQNLRVTVKGLLTEAGSWGAYKHHRDLLPKSETIVLQFRESDQSERQIGRRDYWRKRIPKRSSPE